MRITTRFRRSWPPGIRVQLTLLYTAVFAALMLLFSAIFYTTLQASLASGDDTALQLRTEQIASGISNENGKLTIHDVTGELPGLTTSTPSDLRGNNTNQTGNNTDPTGNGPSSKQVDKVNVGILVRILNAKGQTIYVTPAFRTLTVSAASVNQSLRGVSGQDTVNAQNGQEVRLYSMPLNDNGTTFGVIQVGESLAQLNSTLRSIILTLLAIIPFVLLLGAFGSYWLAKRAFWPIHNLTRTAQKIRVGDLQQRVPIPRTRDEVHDLALTLNEMIERLDMAFTQQRRFVADASHELRTPVTVIRSITDVALAQSLPRKEYISVLRDINAEAERLSQLINDLLALARADEGQLAFDFEPVRLDLLATDVVASLEPLAVEHGITLRTQTTEPATVGGDTARLIQCMIGLVDNALIYTNAGGTVTVSVKAGSSNACFIVHDTGIGIAPEDSIHIFERFYRADPARSRSAGGSGLGLAIVQWIVLAHGGTISVESQVGQGSTFTVSLPLATTSPAQKRDITLEQSQAAETSHLHR